MGYYRVKKPIKLHHMTGKLLRGFQLNYSQSSQGSRDILIQRGIFTGNKCQEILNLSGGESAPSFKVYTDM